MTDIRRIVENHPLFSILSGDQLAQLLSESKIINYSKGIITFRQGLNAEYTFLVLSGFVKLSIEHKKNENFILYVAQPGYFVGLFYLFGQDKYPYTTETLCQKNSLLMIPKKTLLRLCKINPNFMLQYTTILSQKNNELTKTLLILDRKNVRGRIAFVLLYFANEIFHSDKYTIPISRTDISNLANISAENTVRILSELNKDGIISVRNREIEILNKELLTMISEKN